MKRNISILLVGMLIANFAFPIFSSITKAASAYDIALSYVKQGENYAGALKWQISIEGYGNVDSYPDATIYETTKSLYYKALAAINNVPDSSQRTELSQRLEKNVGTHYLRALAFKDAVTLGKELDYWVNQLYSRFGNSPISDSTLRAYYAVGKRIEQASIIFYRVYGKTTREAFIKRYLDPAVISRDDTMWVTSAKRDFDRLEVMLKEQHPLEDILYKISKVEYFNTVVAQQYGTESLAYQQIANNINVFKEAATKLEEQNTTLTGPYKIGEYDANGNITLLDGGYPSKESALSQGLTKPNAQAIFLNGQFLDMKQGYVISKVLSTQTLDIYSDSSLKNAFTYVMTDSEMEYIELVGDAVKVKIAGKEGYVPRKNVLLYPDIVSNKKSYWTVNSNQDLVHVINGQWGVNIERAPQFIPYNSKFTSFDGINFKDQNGNAISEQVHNYFQYLPVLSRTNYTAEELHTFVMSSQDRVTAENNTGRISPFRDIRLLQHIVDLQNEVGINALFILSAALHESYWGTSRLAQEKHNLFGIAAYDYAPFDAANGYATYADCITYFAKNFIRQQYANPSNWKYEGAYLGNKAGGFNVRYASDPYWGEKIAGFMYRIDKASGSKDYRHNLRRVAFATTNVNVRSSAAVTSNNLLYTHENNRPFVVLGKFGDWYQIYPDALINGQIDPNKVGYVSQDYLRFW